ncbi:MAG: universal stress protein [Deinococcota bacterium]
MYDRILIPIDGSTCSDNTLGEAIRLAKLFNASVTLLHAVENPVTYIYAEYIYDLQQDLKKLGGQALEQAQLRCEEAGLTVITKLVENTHPVEAILDAEEDSDLIIMATHGRRGMTRMVLGSVTEEVLRRSNLPHIVLRCDES